jgi:hypothetical protein
VVRDGFDDRHHAWNVASKYYRLNCRLSDKRSVSISQRLNRVFHRPSLALAAVSLILFACAFLLTIGLILAGYTLIDVVRPGHWRLTHDDGAGIIDTNCY